MEKIQQAGKEQGWEILSLNVLDTKEAFDAWADDNLQKYSLTIAFDPAGKARERSIASSKYNAPVLPALYAISPEGKVLGVFGGAEKKEKLLKVLSENGISIDE